MKAVRSGVDRKTGSLENAEPEEVGPLPGTGHQYRRIDFELAPLLGKNHEPGTNKLPDDGSESRKGPVLLAIGIEEPKLRRELWPQDRVGRSCIDFREERDSRPVGMPHGDPDLCRGREPFISGVGERCSSGREFFLSETQQRQSGHPMDNWRFLAGQLARCGDELAKR